MMSYDINQFNCNTWLKEALLKTIKEAAGENGARN